MANRRTLVIWLLFSFITIAPGAYAYIDPGTGQLAWQLILTVGLGLLFSLRRILLSMKIVFRKIAGFRPFK